ncbi:heme-binding protein [Mycolicibacterium aichiense]|uniref:heme-binding protein n=1 Tax=Mycolicibacterium aichiense TaxID=1799 RepID=UPI000E086C2D|nr:heme-binding protein [Mycolicibacterium aichiense]MCV7016965.1 heme-binding protein [Mycolicibacterium aichiense]STZ25732.1 membrane protein [Mycolicibacterium aichiense]
MKFSGIASSKRTAAVGTGLLMGGMAVAAMAAPVASAAPDCSSAGVASTVSSVTGSAHQYLAGHPGANQVLTAAYTQPRPQAEANVRGYFTANPGEYYDLRGILAPIGDTQRTCNVTVLPPDLESAYTMFMAG